MIIRIMGEGQYTVPDEVVERLNELDDALDAALADDQAFPSALAALLETVREEGEPLADECAHFVECIETRKKPISDGWSGYSVVQLLEDAHRSLAQDGTTVRCGVEGPIERAAAALQMIPGRLFGVPDRPVAAAWGMAGGGTD